MLSINIFMLFSIFWMKNTILNGFVVGILFQQKPHTKLTVEFTQQRIIFSSVRASNGSLGVFFETEFGILAMAKCR